MTNFARLMIAFGRVPASLGALSPEDEVLSLHLDFSIGERGQWASNLVATR